MPINTPIEVQNEAVFNFRLGFLCFSVVGRCSSFHFFCIYFSFLDLVVGLRDSERDREGLM